MPQNGEYDNTNSGVLFKNDKGDNPARPDFRGSLNVEGKEYWVSSWKNTSKKDGSNFLSLKLTAKDEQQNALHPVQPQQQPAEQSLDF